VGGDCTCPEGQAACTGSCIDILGDPLNCNGCGAVCPPGGPNTVPTCSAGACDLACVTGYGDCDADPASGCETALAAGDSTHCGGCGVTCGATEECLVDSCVDRAPVVVDTIPAAGAQEVSRDATITLTFSEPVDPTGDWFGVSCTWSGQRGPADFTVSENGSTWTLVPNTPFGPLETCTLTVTGTQVADEDTFDPADAMAADFQFSFRIAALVLLAEDFEAGMPPGWTTFNVDGRTPDPQVSFVNAAWVVREDFAFNAADHAAFSTSYYAPVGAADDWLMTPALVLPAGLNCLLEWQAVTYDPMYSDGYEVRIATIDPSPAGALANPSLVSIPAEASTWTSHSVGLAAYAGSTAYLAFRNNSNDKFLLLVDDVRVTCVP
jgi:hypothetical protein